MLAATMAQGMTTTCVRRTMVRANQLETFQLFSQNQFLNHGEWKKSFGCPGPRSYQQLVRCVGIRAVTATKSRAG